MKEKSLCEYLDGFGAPGNIVRLAAIAALDLGERSRAAKRVIYKRRRRLEIMAAGWDFAVAKLIVDAENVGHEKERG